MENSTMYTVYTDGGSRGNPGIGGWGAYICFENTEEELSGSQKVATNNQMELTAAIKGLQFCPESCAVDLYTDSTYVKDGITKWIVNWKRNGWKTAAKKPVKNQELWMMLDVEVSKRNVAWHWVKGHDGEVGNEKADALCNRAMDILEVI